MTFNQILYIAISVMFTCMALVVLSTRENRMIRYTAFLQMIGVVMWIMGIFMLTRAKTPIDLLIWSRLIFIGPMTIAGAFLILVLSFPRFSLPKEKIQQVVTIIVFFALPILYLLLGEIRWNLDRLNTLHISMQNLAHGPSHPLFTLYFAALFITGLVVLYQKLKHASGIQKEQLRYLFWGTVGSLMVGSIFNLILPLMKNFHFIEYGPFAAIIFIGSTTYSIVQHRLLHIKDVFGRTLVYALLTVVVIGGYGTSIIVSEWSLGRLAGYNSLFITGITTMILVLVFQPIQQFFQEAIDRLFFKTKYDYKKTIEKVSQGIQTTSRLDEIQDLLLNTVVDAMKIEKGSVYILDEKNQRLVKTGEKTTTGKHGWTH